MELTIARPLFHRQNAPHDTMLRKFDTPNRSAVPQLIKTGVTPALKLEIYAGSGEFA